MNDVLPDEAPLWQRLEDAARTVFAQYGYRNIRVPIVESTPLFVRGIGNEYHATGINPYWSHERFQEAHDLIVQAWTRPGP